MESPEAKSIYFINGASAVGKTTLVEELRIMYKNKPWSFIHFDSIGVPPVVHMEKEFRSPSAWQKIKTFEWIHRLPLIRGSQVQALEEEPKSRCKASGFFLPRPDLSRNSEAVHRK